MASKTVNIEGVGLKTIEVPDGVELTAEMIKQALDSVYKPAPIDVAGLSDIAKTIAERKSLDLAGVEKAIASIPKVDLGTIAKALDKKPLDLSPVTKAIQAIPKQDDAKIVAAIKALDKKSPDFSQVAAALIGIDKSLKAMPQLEIGAVVEALDANTAQLAAMAKAFSADRDVSYDRDGNVQKIKVAN